MNRQQFQALANGIYTSKDHWKHKSSEEKHRQFWDFHHKLPGQTFSIYAGVPVTTLIKQKQYSIEHIVPRSYLEEHLQECQTNIRYGATVNPFNLAAAHQRLNARRGSADFDYDDDPINKSFCTPFRSIHRNQIGFDKQGQWVVPYRHRGDIARAILYMHLIYPLPKLQSVDLDALVAWGKMDQPSKWEIRYCQWIQERISIINPFIQQPQLVKDLELQKSICID